MSTLYVRQENEYFCGPAVVEMVLGQLGVVVTQKDSAAEMKTNSEVGTSAKALEALFTRHGLAVATKTKAAWGDIGEAATRGAAIIGYLEPEDGVPHYALVQSVDAQSITLADPLHGSNFALSRTDFESRWHDDENLQYGEQFLMSVTKIENT